ncbi:MAG: papain-like cysteine protease family protein [Actinomycetota bacterium]
MANQAQPLARVRAAIDRRLDRILARRTGRRLDALLGFSDLRRFNSLLALIPIAFMFVLGALRSQYGHIDTSWGVFPLMALISGLNPFVGLLSGLAFGAGDLIQKFIVDDVYYESARTAGDYWGARLGYLVSYSSLIVFGVLPGMLARVGSRIARALTVRTVASKANGAELSRTAGMVSGMVGAVVGAAAGGALSAVAYKTLSAPAFLWRPSADCSCFNLAKDNAMHAIPGASGAGAVGGAGAAVAEGGGPLPQVATGGPPRDPPKGHPTIRQQVANDSCAVVSVQMIHERFGGGTIPENALRAESHQLGSGYRRVGGWGTSPQGVVDQLNGLGHTARQQNMSVDEMGQALRDGKQVTVAHRTPGGGGHRVILSGVEQRGDRTVLTFDDPWTGKQFQRTDKWWATQGRPDRTVVVEK